MQHRKRYRKTEENKKIRPAPAQVKNKTCPCAGYEGKNI